MALEPRALVKLVKRLERDNCDLLSLYSIETAEIEREKRIRVVAYVWGINGGNLVFSHERDDEGYLMNAKLLPLGRLQNYRVLK